MTWQLLGGDAQSPDVVNSSVPTTGSKVGSMSTEGITDGCNESMPKMTLISIQESGRIFAMYRLDHLYCTLRI